jgi:hypothetical protein
VLCRSVRGRNGGGLRQRSVCRRKDPPGANLDHDELHDDLQCAGGDVPSCLFRTVGAIDWFDIVDDRTGAVPRFQPDGKHVVRHELLDDANFVSDDLRPHIAFTVIRPRASTQFGDRFRN